MKKLVLMFSVVLFTILAAHQVQAQGLGVRGGVNFQNVTGKNVLGGDLKNDPIAAYHFGLIGEAAIAPAFLFQTGLLYSVKGAKSDNVLGTFTQRVSYLDIPLHLVFKPAVGNGHIILGFGPYLGVGLNGKVKAEIGGEESDIDIDFEKKIDGTDEDTYYIRRFDAGGDLFFGYEFSGGLSLQLNTQLGMLKINPEDEQVVEDDSRWNNVGFGLSAMYRFGPKS